MSREKKQQYESLLDLHLDRLDEHERELVVAECRDDPELEAASERLRKTLRPLDQWTVAAVPANLADRVLSELERRASDVGADFPVPLEAVGRPSWPFVSLRGIVAVAACILLLFGVFVPGVSKLRYESRKALCADNLGSIFRGTAMYQASFGGSLPFAGAKPGAAWLPSDLPGQAFASNSRHLYLLVKLDFGPTPGDFVCPGGSSGTAMAPHNLKACADFDRACNITYATMNLSGSDPNLRPAPRLAYLGDANPLFIDARFDPSVDPDRANSRAHGGRGQMILTLDGKARWMTTPVYGSQKDNVWLAGNIREYTGVECPTSKDDAQLVPGYPATDPSLR